MGLNHAHADQCLCLKCFHPLMKYRIKHKTTDINGVKFHTCLSKLLHVGWVIKQLFPRCLGRPDALLPSAFGLGQLCFGPSSAPRGYNFDYSLNNHEITVL